MKSNITIASNVYIRSSIELQNDDEFIKRVRGSKALNVLKSQLSKSIFRKLSRIQIDEMKQNVICRLGKKPREHTYGKAIATVDDDVDGNADNGSESRIVWSCRCENTDCSAYEKCMSLPNALRINRGNASETDGANGVGKVGKDAYESGFDFEECDFELPYVAIELPISTPIFADECLFEKDERVLVVCENPYDAGYFSTILYKNKVKHCLLNSGGDTLDRRIADVFWDYCEDEISETEFFDRSFVRISDDEAELAVFYDALYKLCGNGSGGLNISKLADVLSEPQKQISECILNKNSSDCSVTVATVGFLPPAQDYEKVFVLEGDSDLIPTIKNVSGISDLKVEVIRKNAPSEWVFVKSMLGRNSRVEKQEGEAKLKCLDVELGLWGDAEEKCFLSEQNGDSIALQLYIAEKIKQGDELTVEKGNDAKYRFCHNGNNLGEFPSAVIRELAAMEGFPEDFTGLDGIYVRNIITCVVGRDNQSFPLRFRKSRIWLGLEIAGYAKVRI